MSPLSQHQTCVSGQTCKFHNVVGQDLYSSNSLMVLDTCAVAPAPVRFGTAGQTVGLSSSGAMISWGDTPVSAAGGFYRLCWCAGGPEFSCSIPENFRTDAGILELVGVSPMKQHRTCVSGQVCLVEGIEGRDLDPSDITWALDTCGYSITPPRFAGGAMSQATIYIYIYIYICVYIYIYAYVYVYVCA